MHTILNTRAKMYQDIRDFFNARHVLEVETPLLSRAGATDIHITSLTTFCRSPDTPKPVLHFLQTSPEFAMKRLLSAGSGDIYQITKAFRDEEVGAWHRPEFTLLEWYRVGFDHHALMQEMNDFLQIIFGSPPSEKKSYVEIFQQYLQMNPHTVTLAELKNCAAQKNISVSSSVHDLSKDDWLMLLMSQCIEVHLGRERPTLIYDYPASQAALARIRVGSDGHRVAERFEVYIDGVELANGFHELADAKEQRARFQQDLLWRQQHGYPPVVVDENLLSALKKGLPDCAGVAVGLDRLLMLKLGVKDMNQINI